jgi:hypothetical protein
MAPAGTVTRRCVGQALRSSRPVGLALFDPMRTKAAIEAEEGRGHRTFEIGCSALWYDSEIKSRCIRKNQMASLSRQLPDRTFLSNAWRLLPSSKKKYHQLLLVLRLEDFQQNHHRFLLLHYVSIY